MFGDTPNEKNEFPSLCWPDLHELTTFLKAMISINYNNLQNFTIVVMTYTKGSDEVTCEVLNYVKNGDIKILRQTLQQGKNNLASGGYIDSYHI
jgi:hypothetical protein